MTLSQLALEDVEDLYSGPLFLMADPMGPLLDQDEEEALSPSSSLEGKPASPPLSFSSHASSLSPYQTLSLSPPPSPPPPPTHSSSFLGTKAGSDPMSLSWLGAGDLLDARVGADNGEADDAFMGMDWMSEKIDLSELDLDSLIGSSDESPGSPEDLLASLDSHMDLDLDPFESPIPDPQSSLDLGLTLPSIPSLPLELPPLPEAPEAPEAEKTEVAPDEEVLVKSEPPSPCPPSPAYTLELGSEVDVLDAEKAVPPLTATLIPDPSGLIQTPSPIVLSIPASGHYLVVLAKKEDSSPVLVPDPTIKSSSSDSDSDSGIESVAGSPGLLPSPPRTPPPTAGSSRTKPYSKPEPTTTTTAAASTPKTPRVKSVSGAPKVVEKKLKKMEQNKTAATRYRQKKRVEQELLLSECEELEKRNCELSEKAESISREIQYLKDLMEEVRKHRRGKSSPVA